MTIIGKFLHFLNRVCFVSICLEFAFLGGASTAGFFGQLGEFFELASHFRFLYAVAFVPFVFAFLCLQSWKLFGLSVLLAVANAIPIVKLYIPESSNQNKPLIAQITLLQANLWGPKNSHLDEILDLIKAKSPDLIGFSEITATWASNLEGKLPAYPYRIIETRSCGVALFSKYPFENYHFSYFGTINRPRITASMRLSGKTVTVIFAHPVIPIYLNDIRNGELLEIAGQCGSAKTPLILFGDLNCSPWSYYFEKLLELGRLTDSERGFGLHPTWSARMHFPWFPIDHCLTSSEFFTLKREVGPDIGSDHLPVFVKLELRQSH